MKMNLKLKILPFPLCIWAVNLMAQSTDTLKTEDIEIINVYEPVISDAFKTLETPKIVDTIPPPIIVKYDLLNRQFKTDFPIDTIKAATMKAESLAKLYKFHIKLGAGNHFATLGDASFHNLRSRDQSYGGRIAHYGVYNPSINNSFSQFSENNLNLYGKKFLTDHTLSCEVEHNRDIIHFFGFNSDSFPSLTKNDIRQRFAKTGLKFGLMSFFKDSSDINYDLGLNYYNLFDSYKAKENNIFISADFNKFYNRENLILSSSFDFNSYQNMFDSTSGSNGILKIQPGILSKGNRWQLNLGLGIFADADNTANFFFKPVAEFRYNMVSNLMVPYAGISGGITRNNFRSFTDENPFLVSEVLLKNSNKSQVYAGIRGAESSEISFNIFADISQIKNMPLFQFDSSSPQKNKFLVIYDDVNVTGLHLDIGYEKNEKIKFLFSGEYLNYQTYYEDRAWYKPRLKGNISVNYNLKEKIIVTAELFGISEQFAKTNDSLDIASGSTGVYYRKLKGIADINLGAEYRYNSRLSAFIHLNNLGSVRYYRWLNYPTMRLNILGGVSYSF